MKTLIINQQPVFERIYRISRNILENITGTRYNGRILQDLQNFYSSSKIIESYQEDISSLEMMMIIYKL